MMFPAAAISWWIRDDDVAATRGLPAPEPDGAEPTAPLAR